MSFFWNRQKEADYQRLCQENQQLNQVVKEQREQLQQLEAHIAQLEAQEQAIVHLLVDAKQLASTIQKEADAQAKRVLYETEVQAQQQLIQFEADFKQLVASKQDLTMYEQTMRQEILATIERYQTFFKQETAQSVLPTQSKSADTVIQLIDEQLKRLNHKTLSSETITDEQASTLEEEDVFTYQVH